MSITERAVGNAVVLDVRGPLLGFEVGDLLERAVDRLGHSGSRTIVADLQHVPTIDAGGLGALLMARRASVRHHARLRLAHPGTRVRLLIGLCRLGAVLPTFDSLTEALGERAAAAMVATSATTAIDQFAMQ